MKLILKEDIVEKYPDLLIGVVAVKGVNNTRIGAELENFIRESEEKLRNAEWSDERLLEHPFISAWRDIYLSFGVKSKSVRKDPPTAENTIRYVLAGNNLKRINAIVNAYLCVELECFLPIGGYDLDLVAGDIVLRFSKGGELFEPSNGDNRKTKAGEVVYSDDKRVLTYRWNKMDCGATQITQETKNFVLCIESADNRISRESLENATNRLVEVLEQFCPGEYRHFVADGKANNEWNIF